MSQSSLKNNSNRKVASPCKNSSPSFQATETRTLSLFNKLRQPIFFFPRWVLGSVFLTRHKSNCGLQRSLILGPCLGTIQFTYLGAVLDGVLIRNSTWIHIQHYPFWKFLTQQLYNGSHILPDDFSSHTLPVSLLFNCLHPMARSGTLTPIWYLFLAISLEDLIRRGSTEQERSIIDYAVSSSL